MRFRFWKLHSGRTKDGVEGTRVDSDQMFWGSPRLQDRVPTSSLQGQKKPQLLPLPAGLPPRLGNARSSKEGPQAVLKTPQGRGGRCIRRPRPPGGTLACSVRRRPSWIRAARPSPRSSSSCGGGAAAARGGQRRVTPPPRLSLWWSCAGNQRPRSPPGRPLRKPSSQYPGGKCQLPPYLGRYLRFLYL